MVERRLDIVTTETLPTEADRVEAAKRLDDATREIVERLEAEREGMARRDEAARRAPLYRYWVALRDSMAIR